MYFNYRSLEGHNAPVMIVLGKRGIGKTFEVIKNSIYDGGYKNQQFVYVVETKEMVDTLAQNQGEKFFRAVKDYCQDNKSIKNNKLLALIQDSVVESGDTDIKDNKKAKIQGGTIKSGNTTLGYILSYNDFANIKRNNFNVKRIVVDEFIPEKIDIRNIDIKRKIVSIVQSIARLKDVKIYLLGNPIRMSDPILTVLKLNNMRQGETRIIKIENEPFIVAHYVDNKQYLDHEKATKNSVAGKLAVMFKETELDEGVSRTSLSDNLHIPLDRETSKLYMCLHGEAGSVRIQVTPKSNYYCVQDYGKNKGARYTVDKKYVTPNVTLLITLKDFFIQMMSEDRIRFESETEYYTLRCNLGILPKN